MQKHVSGTKILGDIPNHQATNRTLQNQPNTADGTDSHNWKEPESPSQKLYYHRIAIFGKLKGEHWDLLTGLHRMKSNIAERYLYLLTTGQKKKFEKLKGISNKKT